MKNSQIIILGVCIAAATIASSVILSQGFLKVMKFTREQISVTGSAQKNIKSDYVVWTASFSKRDADLATAYKKLKEDLGKVKKYLVAKGVSEKEIIVDQIAIKTVTPG
ncbi:MAG: SIMPL domain-containing protein [Candidatus Omnitrophica bacterium]|nr:SIMPL domain-containing protein [Candidatus Omnitrophota bacterium]